VNFKSVDSVISIRFVCDVCDLCSSAESCSGTSEADEGLEASRHVMEQLLLGAGAQLENEEYLMGISCRLQAALEKMLMAISDASNQVQRFSCRVGSVGGSLLIFRAHFISSSHSVWHFLRAEKV